MVPGPYWRAARVVKLARENWEAFDGAQALAGLDPLRLPLPRFCRAVLVWLRGQIVDGTERGAQQWEQLVTWLNTPPTGPVALASQTQLEGQSRAAAIRAQAEAAVGREDSAFAAYTGAMGR